MSRAQTFNRDDEGRWVKEKMTTMFWTQTEVAEQFRAEIVAQKKKYDAILMWSKGKFVFPNYPFYDRIVIGFNENFIIPESLLHEPDPMPKPWRIEVRATPHVTGEILNVLDGRFETLNEAFVGLELAYNEMLEYAKILEITSDSERQAKCQSCGKIFTYKQNIATGDWELPKEETAILRPMHGMDFVHHHAGHGKTISEREETYFYVDLTKGEPNEPRK